MSVFNTLVLFYQLLFYVLMIKPIDHEKNKTKQNEKTKIINLETRTCYLTVAIKEISVINILPLLGQGKKGQGTLRKMCHNTSFL